MVGGGPAKIWARLLGVGVLLPQAVSETEWIKRQY